MRTRADVFAIVTITLLFIAQTLAFNLRSITDGAQGKAVAMPPFPVETYDWPFYYAMLALLAFAMGVSFYFRRSKIGLSLLAVRADEDKAHGVGVRVTGVKLIAFGVSVGITAMIGGVWAYYVGFVYPQFAVDPLVTIGMVLMTFLGGRATLWGPVIGAFILVPAQQTFAYQFGASQVYLLAYAAIFLIIMLLLPRGILPTITDRLRSRRKRGQGGAAGHRSIVRRSRGGGRRDDRRIAGGGTMTALLEVDRLSKRFGGVRAVDDCTFSVEEGTITGLIGPNGSGKTTAFNIITGYLKSDSGAIRFGGHRVKKPSPARLYRQGLSRTFQQARIFPELSVEENLVVAAGYSWRALFGARLTRDRPVAGA